MIAVVIIGAVIIDRLVIFIINIIEVEKQLARILKIMLQVHVSCVVIPMIHFLVVLLYRCIQRCIARYQAAVVFALRIVVVIAGKQSTN